MKRHITFKIMLPLTVIFILTLSVNLSTTGAMQDVRTAMQTLAASAESMETADITRMAEETAADISAALSSNGLLSSTQLLMVVVSIVIAYLCVTKPLKTLSVQLEELTRKLEEQQGDLGERLVTKKTDEIGRLASGVNLYMDRLQTVMKQIKAHSVSLDESSCNISTKVTDSNREVEVVSGQAEALHGEIQSFVASIGEVISDMESLNGDSRDMAEAVVSGKSYSAEIRGRADHVRELADSSKTESDRITETLRADLQSSVENSKSVSAIEKLTDEILSISSQTNLLALNASIEAARAGEAGRGFAVVADEIRELADNSRNTANSIQQISQQVTAAVRSLAEASEKLLEFVSTNVSADYEEFVKAAEEYLKDADTVEEMMDAFDKKASFFLKATEQMDSRLNAVSQEAMNENSNIGTLKMAIGELVENMSLIQKYTSMNDGVSEALKAEIQKFKAV